MNTDGMRAIDDLIRWHREAYRTAKASRPLFPSRNGKGKKRMTRRAAHNVLKTANVVLGSSLKKTADHTLLLELALRGYDLSRLRDNDETTSEIVKIS